MIEARPQVECERRAARESSMRARRLMRGQCGVCDTKIERREKLKENR
jgi:hypothetical protein